MIMVTRSESGWQSGKSLAECMRCMLDNEIATDVCFEVGPPDGAVVKIRAHKCMLISRSPVFEAMFSSGMIECGSGPETKIRVEDIDATIFRQLLIFVYSDGVSVNFETAASLIYAARKYMLPNLVRECETCLSKGLDVNNVIQVLEQSLSYDDMELKTNCLTCISQNANAILTGAEIMSATPQTMEIILQMDNIPVKEILIYETCIKWAERQLKSKGLTAKATVTDQQIREMLGDLLYKIRFPTMELTEFAEISEGRNLLTEAEKTSIYYFLATNKKVSRLMFCVNRRFAEEPSTDAAVTLTERKLGEEIWIDRTVVCVNGPWSSQGKLDGLDITTDRDILLSGVGLYSGHNLNGYAVDIEVMQSSTSLLKKRVTVPCTEDSNPVKIPLDEAIFIKAGIVHTVKALSHGNICYYGNQCKAICTKDNVTFTFNASAKSTYTRETRGQIPRLYFYKTGQ